jgi:hypothetical protein
MPRRSRIDAPGALHHIIARGIDRQSIFQDDADRDNFLDRLGNILSETQTACFAWTLIPNNLWAKAEDLAASGKYGRKERRTIGQPQQLCA